MTETMTQRGVGLFAPTSRQDVVSQLLSAYANSFGQGNPSPSRLSPAPADKALPPPPPRSDSLARKPLPAFERAEQRMSTKFPLRSKSKVSLWTDTEGRMIHTTDHCSIFQKLSAGSHSVHHNSSLHFVFFMMVTSQTLFHCLSYL
jgi:hypothetical protein